ncbi:MAG TPA: peptide deformylase [Rhizomicrobium sp.]|nr:peptide deformylase [Rhizomicrobium sp.]
MLSSKIRSFLDPPNRNPYLLPMSIRPVLTAPDPRLKAVSEEVSRVDEELKKLIDDMLETMYAEEGIGLAAIQVGAPKRLLVMDLAQKEGRREPQAFINPRILWASDETMVVQEGCLSVPDIWEDVERPARITAEFLDRDGVLKTVEADGLFSTCLQHEMDHLNGVLFIDHLSKLKRSMALRKVQKAKRLAQAS